MCIFQFKLVLPLQVEEEEVAEDREVVAGEVDREEALEVPKANLFIIITTCFLTRWFQRIQGWKITQYILSIQS